MKLFFIEVSYQFRKTNERGIFEDRIFYHYQGTAIECLTSVLENDYIPSEKHRLEKVEHTWIAHIRINELEQGDGFLKMDIVFEWFIGKYNLQTTDGLLAFVLKNSILE